MEIRQESKTFDLASYLAAAACAGVRAFIVRAWIPPMRCATDALTARWRANRGCPSKSEDTTRTDIFDPSQPESEKSTTSIVSADEKVKRNADSTAAAITDKEKEAGAIA